PRRRRWPRRGCAPGRRSRGAAGGWRRPPARGRRRGASWLRPLSFAAGVEVGHPAPGGLGWLDVAAEAGVDRRKRSVLVKRRAGDLAVEDLLGGGEVAGGDRGVVLGGGEAGHARVPGGLGGQEPGVAALADREGPQQEAVAAVLEPGDQLL